VNPIWTPPVRPTISYTYVQMERARREFGEFACQAWPQVDPAPLVWGWHNEAIAEHLTWISLGQIRFLMINIPPRMSKSTLCSVLWPAWEWIDHPEVQWLTASYALQLSRRDSAKSRRLITSKWYRERWGDKYSLMKDESTASQYLNDKGGRRVITATQAAATGEGGNRVSIDDPHNVLETESDLIRTEVHNFWDNTMASRLNQQNVDSWMLIGQRTHEDDLFGHVMRNEDMSEIVHLVLPNEFDPKRRCVTVNLATKKKWRDPRRKTGELLCPDRLNAKSTARLKKKMVGYKYQLQFNQDPKAGGGQILKREFWRPWPKDKPIPMCDYIFSSWDTALRDTQTADYSARSDWGLFYPTNEDGVPTNEQNLILFGAWRGQVPYWKLRRVAKSAYETIQPDTVLVEQKVSGISLIQDFRRIRMRVTPVKLDHGGRVKIDMKERAELASPVFEQGLVWYIPDDHKPEEKRIMEDVIDECAKVPGGTNDDLATTVCQAAMWLRRRRELTTWEEEDPDGSVRLYKRRKGSIYG
jgi:phage terminase large subunit-like protein